MATHFHFDNTLGAGFIGCLITATLYGVTCIQTFTYFQHSSRDHKVVKCAVGCLLILDTLHFIFISDTLYWYLVTNFTDPTVIGRIPWSVFGGLLVTPISDGLVRCFFTYRVWVLSRKNRIITYPLMGMVVAIFGISMAYGIKGLTLPTFEQIATISWILYAGLGCLVVGDGYIALVLCYFLYKGRTGFNKGTDSLINVLLLYTVNTGLLTSVFALACLIAYAAMPRNFVAFALYFPLSKLYFNALLASLNARGHISRMGEPDGHASIPFSTQARAAQGTIPLEFAHPTSSTQLSGLGEREEFKTGSVSV